MINTDTTKERLRQIMYEKRITQTGIAKMCEPYCDAMGIRIGPADISAYVNGKYLPAQKKLTVLGLALDVSEGWLMGLDVPRQRSKEPLADERQTVGDDQEFINLFMKLSPENRTRILDLIKALLTSQL